MYTPSLPYRRLVKFANGIWDENRKTFYPFIAYGANATTTITAKTGIMYLLTCASVCGENNGDKAVSSNYVQITQNGQTKIVCLVKVPTTVAASNVNSSEALYCDVNVLADPKSPIYIKIESSNGYASVVYAEIPIEGSGVPVVVQ